MSLTPINHYFSSSLPIPNPSVFSKDHSSSDYSSDLDSPPAQNYTPCSFINQETPKQKGLGALKAKAGRASILQSPSSTNASNTVYLLAPLELMRGFQRSQYPAFDASETDEYPLKLNIARMCTAILKVVNANLDRLQKEGKRDLRKITSVINPHLSEMINFYGQVQELPVYVGQTSSMQSRLLSHASGVRKHPKYPAYRLVSGGISLIMLALIKNINSPKARTAVEGSFIKGLGANLNQRPEITDYPRGETWDWEEYDEDVGELSATKSEQGEKIDLSPSLFESEEDYSSDY